MPEPRQSRTERSTVDQTSPPVEPVQQQYKRESQLNSFLVWVGIVAGLMFIVALVFFSGFFIGRNSYGNFRGGYHQPGMMGPSQAGPYDQMWPGMMGPGGMMGPYGPWPGQQPPTTTIPTTPRP